MFRCKALQRSRLDKQMPICQTKNISKDQLIDAKCASVNEYSLYLYRSLARDFLLPSCVAFTLSAQIIEIISKENLPKNYVRLLNYFGTEQFLFFFLFFMLNFFASFSFADLFSNSIFDHGFGLPCASFFTSTTTTSSTKT